MEQIENGVGDTQQEPFNRPPRIWPPLPDGVVTFPAPPNEERETQPPSPLTLLLPLLSIAVLMGISVALSHGSFQQLAFLLPMAIFTIVNPLSSLLDARQKRKALRRKQAAQNKQYKEHPTFIEGLVSVVQKGRSLGVHLILATQKPTGSVNPNIWSNLKFRICLRVASLQDSRDMLGRSEAGLLPSTIPGRAYFQIGAEIFELFQSARTTLPARISDIPSLDPAQMIEETTDMQVLMGLLEPHQATQGADLFRPWPDPLPHRIYLPDVYQRSTPFVNANTHADASMTPPYGWLRFPVGLIDLPPEQRQEPFLLDLPREGHMLIAGASGTGKSAFLRTIITSLALTHSPAQLHLYLIDFGGQALRVFEKLPQTPLLTSKSFCCGHETCVSTLLWQDHQPISPARMPCCSKYALAV